ncbi:MAG TPA: hypothetical protein PLJ21_09460 [Pseudobdellovibrionaceae bacterium]|nr:hypothetical protein [Pseudobdellovibrionaceae bacterium]
MIAHRLLATIKGTDHITKNFTQIQSSIYELFERHPKNLFRMMKFVKDIWIPKLQSVYESAPSNSELNQQIRAFFVSLKMMNPEIFSNLQLKEAASPPLSGKVNVASAGKKACVPIIFHKLLF